MSTSSPRSPETMVNNGTTDNPGIMKSYSSTMETKESLGANGDLTARNHSQHGNENSNVSASEQKPFLQQKLSMEDGITTSRRKSTGSNDAPEYNMMAWFFCLLLGGLALGLALPKNSHLPTRTWQISSNVIGYTYFLAWSLSFYPQVTLNRNRKTTHGLSVDFCVLNVLGYVCYTIYTTNFYWNENVIRAYKNRNSGEDGMAEDATGENLSQKAQITVQGNDVAFAIHAVLLASITLAQIGMYDSFIVRPPSRRVYLFLLATGAFCSVYLLTTWIFQGQVNVLGFLYVLGTIKIGITIAKYIPQALLNRSRKSTVGWNVYNVILDLSGGILSLSQLVGDCADMGDWTGITGNPAKIAIALVTICFDLLFLIQHYILYPADGSSSSYSHYSGIESTDNR